MNKVIRFLKNLIKKELPKLEKWANQPCYDKFGRFLGWYSRSVAAAIFVYCKDEDGDWCILGSERGEEAADYRGFWNCCCGYLSFNESIKECALRELYEETGVFITDEASVKFIDYDDSPQANRQNVTFHFATFIDDAVTSDFTFSKKHNEGKEVGEIKWIKIVDVENYMWAFGHNKRIIEIFNANVN